MRLEMGMNLGLQQKMMLAPRMIQSMEILQLATLALQERLQQELQENPVMELKEAAGEDPHSIDLDFTGSESLPPEKPADPDRDPLVIDEKGGNELDFDRLDALSRDWEDAFNEDHRPSRNGLDEEGDRKHDAMQNMAARPQSLQEYLNEQTAFLETTPDQARLLKHVISCVDHTGYLGVRVKKDESENEVFVPISLEEIASSYDQPVTVEQVEEVLQMVQKLDPPGVGARDLKECLLLQVTNDTPHAEVVRTLILHHLEDIQHNRLPAIQKKTGYDLPMIKEGIEALRHLNPRPGAIFNADSNRYIVPDIAVERRDDGTYDVRLLDDWMPNIYISRRYIEMYRDRSADPKTREYLKRKIQQAQWLQESIEQRRNTLEKVTRKIIEHQRAFLEKGPEFIEPLKMQQIADQVGVHVTTVSRAVDDKWVQTPRGVFPLKRFFGGGTHTASGEEVAWETIKQKLLEIIGNEDKSNPLSDEELVDQLEKSGYPVARRTVTKYRKMLNIPSSRQRKDWTLAASSASTRAGGHDEDE